MSWANLGSRLLGFVVLLPMVLINFTVEEVNLWLLFQAVVALQSMVDFGFTPTFIRFVAYAQSEEGKPKSELHLPASWLENKVNISDVIGAMRGIYTKLALVAFVLMAVIGSFAVMKSVSLLEDSMTGWLAWIVIVASNSLMILGGMFGAYLQGANQIALYQRWQAIIGAVTVCLAIIALLLGGGLLQLVLVMQMGVVASFLVSRKLAVENTPSGTWSSRVIKPPAILNNVWSAAWRSGIGVAMTYGTIQGAGVVYAQVATVADAAAFLLAQRVLQVIISFSNVPFYTCIPRMARMFASGKLDKLIECARLGMLRTNWLLITGILIVGFGAEPLLAVIESETTFVSNEVWLLLGLAALVERVGAMHLQLYSVTNHIVWHIANGVTGVLFFCVIPITYLWLGMLGLPLGVLIGYIAFYLPYSIYKSYSEFSMPPLHMDGLPSFVPILLMSSLFLLFFIAGN